MPPRVRLHQHLAVLAADARVVRRFETVQSGIVDADVTEQVRGELLLRIEPAALLDEADPLDLECFDALLQIARSGARR
jgi:hypothetical protein